MNDIREELESLREGSQTQRKRFLDMVLVLLRDVGDIGSIMGGQMNDQKVRIYVVGGAVECVLSRNRRWKISIKPKKNSPSPVSI